MLADIFEMFRAQIFLCFCQALTCMLAMLCTLNSKGLLAVATSSQPAVHEVTTLRSKAESHIHNIAIKIKAFCLQIGYDLD